MPAPGPVLLPMNENNVTNSSTRVCIKAIRHFTDNEKSILQGEFSKNPNPTGERKIEIAHDMGRSFKAISKWFSRKRMSSLNENNVDISSPKVRGRHFTSGQLSILKKEFSENQYPNSEKIIEIANESGLTQKQILKWFQRREQESKMKSKPLLQLHQKLKELENNFENNQQNTSEMLENYVYTPRTSSMKRMFSDIEKEILKSEFFKNRRPTSHKINEIAQKFHTSDQKIKTWFVNRRDEISRLKRLIQQKQDGVFASETDSNSIRFETDSKDEISTIATEETDETFEIETGEKNEDSVMGK